MATSQLSIEAQCITANNVMTNSLTGFEPTASRSQTLATVTGDVQSNTTTTVRHSILESKKISLTTIAVPLSGTNPVVSITNAFPDELRPSDSIVPKIPILVEINGVERLGELSIEGSSNTILIRPGTVNDGDFMLIQSTGLFSYL